MKYKVQKTNKDLEDVVRELKDNEFKLISNCELDKFKNIFPDGQRQLLDSASIGLSANHLILTTNRIDTTDEPKLINTEVFICKYDMSAQSACVTGCLVNRGGEGWHHVEPGDIFAVNISFDELGLIHELTTIPGSNLSEITMKAIGAAHAKIIDL